MSLAGTRLLARWSPACRRREPGLRLLRRTWEGRPRHCRLQGCGRRQGARASGGNREALSTVAGSAGGPACSSEEALVIGVEPRGRAIWASSFGQDLKGNLYKVWNRMSSGSYFPPPVRAVEIPKSHGDGVRILGVPTVADRLAQTVVARRLEQRVEEIFHTDSDGYRVGRSAIDAVAKCRQRCWETDWVLDLDIQAFLDPSSHCSFADCRV